MPRIALEPVQIMTKEAYLEFEEAATEKHEFVHGQIYAMAGGTRAHNRVSGNLFAYLWNASRETECEVFNSDMRLEASEVYYYPDAMVVCDKTDNDSTIVRRPCLIAEVLSKSTSDIDRTEKLFAYQKLESLQVYILLAQDTIRAEIYRRDLEGWRYELYETGDSIKLPCVNAEIKLDDLYKNVELESA
jgi:Uma2 family endonuclease